MNGLGTQRIYLGDKRLYLIGTEFHTWSVKIIFVQLSSFCPLGTGYFI